MSKIKSSICLGCTLLCDDVGFSPGDKVAKNACDAGQAFFQLESQTARLGSTTSAKDHLDIDAKVEGENSQPNSDLSSHWIDGKPVSLDDAIVRSAEILRRSKAPLICGLDQMPTQAQQTAWKIAERIGATIDTTLTNHGRSSMFALQRIGKVTASIGEIANRSDLVLFWFCDPVATHPRLLERLAKNNTQRKIVVVDQRETATAKIADQFFQVEPNNAADLLANIRAELSGLGLGAENETSIKLLAMMKNAKYGSVFYGQVTEDSAFELIGDSLSRLIRRLNDETRFVGLKLRADFNGLSAENVIAWSSGFPFAVSYAGKLPRYNWLEHSAETILTRGECDSILFASGTDLQNSFAGLSRTAKDVLGSIPKIVLTPIPDFQSDVVIQVGVPGLTESGEFCRTDDVSFGLSAVAGASETSSTMALEKLFNELSGS